VKELVLHLDRKCHRVEGMNFIKILIYFGLYIGSDIAQDPSIVDMTLPEPMGTIGGTL
jgi:hypothetical protein